MSKVEYEGRLDYSKFDKMDTDILEALLRANFDAPEAEQMEPEAALYILNLLSERQEDETLPTATDIAAKKTEFDEKYYPMLENEQLLQEFLDDMEYVEDSQDNVIIVKPWINHWRRFASAAAVLVIFMFSGTLTAYAFGYDPFAAIARWNDEHFWFEKQINTAEITDILSDYSDVEYLVPKWLPEGYEFEDVEIIPYPNGRIIRSSFVKNTEDEGQHICINYKQDIDNVQTIYEKTSDNAIIYDKGGVEHYIIHNSTNLTIVWLSDDLECSIVGSFSVAEAKKIINSLYN